MTVQTDNRDNVGPLGRRLALRYTEIPFNLTANGNVLVSVRWHGPISNRYYVIVQHYVNSKAGIV